MMPKILSFNGEWWILKLLGGVRAKIKTKVFLRNFPIVSLKRRPKSPEVESI